MGGLRAMALFVTTGKSWVLCWPLNTPEQKAQHNPPTKKLRPCRGNWKNILSNGGSRVTEPIYFGHATSTPPRDAWNFELCTSSAIIYPEVSASVYAQLLRPNGLRRTHHSFAVPWFRRMARVLRHKASGCDEFA